LNKAEERAIINKIVAGDTNSYRLIVDALKDRIAAVCMSMLKNETWAEEVGQDTFVRLYNALPKFKGDSNLSTYATRIAINLCKNKLDSVNRRRNRFLVQTDSHNTVPSSQESTQKKLENQELINLALDVLKPEERSVVVLRLMEGYSIKETAEIIGIKEGTVMSKLSRAIKKMQTVLDDLK